ncbi:peptide chain release factor 2 [Patescibacteria group bacterium]|nr:peptide chain release factor 2 [Patescibacteria group bacterium]MBU1721670.1 peptide chain release factor 2 [Patescibacteria group bacterium]MBU1900979.1 peptide chain release factor 2 [Patescibacteria group bacterium]
MDKHEVVSLLQELGEKGKTIYTLLRIEEKKKEIPLLEAALSEASIWDTPDIATKKGQRLTVLQNEVAEVEQIVRDSKDIQSLVELSDEDSKDFTEMLTQAKLLQKKVAKLEDKTLFDGRYDDHAAIVSFAAGAGGTEAQDWAEMLRRMVMRYAEKKGWKTTLLDESRGTEVGIKSATIRIVGEFAYGHMKAEHGVHRLVRISPFDAESMRHTSFASIEVTPEIDSAGAVEIDPKELRIDTFMSSGKGGQSVNTTYSAVRVVHIPTGITVSCQNERSQIQNKETALRVLQSKLQILQEKAEEEKRQSLRGEHKTAEWGNQIRSYVLHPYKMVKDARTKHETVDTDAVLDGELDPFVYAYLRLIKE